MGKICSFFGHRVIDNKKEVETNVARLVEDLIKNDFTVFQFGGFGEFDELCYSLVSALKERYPTIKRVYCLCEEKYLQEKKRQNVFREEDYEEFVYYVPSFDYWYTRIYYRNCEMIENSDYIIFYAENRADSGAYKALKYAKKARKKYINLFYENLEENE